LFFTNLLKSFLWSKSLVNVLLSSYSKKKDVSQAILERKKAPHKLTCEDARNDDNSIVEMTQAKMDELKIFKGDTVLIKGKQPFPHFHNLFRQEEKRHCVYCLSC